MTKKNISKFVCQGTEKKANSTQSVTQCKIKKRIGFIRFEKLVAWVGWNNKYDEKQKSFGIWSLRSGWHKYLWYKKT